MPVLLFLMLQYESFHTVFSAPESMSKRLRNCISGKIPKVDAVRDLLSGSNPEEVRKIHEETVDTLKKNRVFWDGTTGGYVVTGIDGAEKDEGELTGGKRLIERLRQRHGHFADVIVADALYLNAPFINTIKENGLETVIWLKDEKRLIFQDAEGFFNQGEGKARLFQRGKKMVEVWELSGFEIENCLYRIRVVKYHEMWLENGKEAER